MADEIKAINITTNRIDNISISDICKRDDANIKEEHDKLSELISDLTNKSSNDNIIDPTLIDYFNSIKGTPKTNFLKDIFNKIIGKNNTNQLTKEDIAAIFDIEQMACLPE